MMTNTNIETLHQLQMADKEATYQSTQMTSRGGKMLNLIHWKSLAMDLMLLEVVPCLFRFAVPRNHCRFCCLGIADEKKRVALEKEQGKPQGKSRKDSVRPCYPHRY